MTPADDHGPQRPTGQNAPSGDPGLVPVDGLDSHDAQIQEMQAGAAPLVRIIPITAQTPPRNRPGHVATATVPFLTVAAVRWSKVTVGDTVGRLVNLLQERGGIWLAKHTTATLTWTVSAAPTGEGSAIASTPSWVRLDAAFTGAWSGHFSLAAPASRLAANLWCVATSPLVGILPDEAADKALPPVGDATPVAWQSFTNALDNSVHTTTRPPETIRDLVIRSAWPGSDLLKKRER